MRQKRMALRNFLYDWTLGWVPAWRRKSEDRLLILAKRIIKESQDRLLNHGNLFRWLQQDDTIQELMKVLESIDPPTDEFSVEIERLIGQKDVIVSLTGIDGQKYSITLTATATSGSITRNRIFFQ